MAFPAVGQPHCVGSGLRFVAENVYCLTRVVAGYATVNRRVGCLPGVHLPGLDRRLDAQVMSSPAECIAHAR